MAKYIVQMIDAHSGEVLETEDEVFDNEQDAQDYACECGGAFSAGAETLSLMGRDYIPREDVDFVVEEVEE